MVNIYFKCTRKSRVAVTKLISTKGWLQNLTAGLPALLSGSLSFVIVWNNRNRPELDGTAGQPAVGFLSRPFIFLILDAPAVSPYDSWVKFVCLNRRNHRNFLISRMDVTSSTCSTCKPLFWMLQLYSRVYFPKNWKQCVRFNYA